MNGIHRVVLKVSGGRVGWKAGSMPVLELTTIGRKSGQPRSVMLTSPVQEGDTVVIVASRGGDDTHPAWFLNLQANPEVEVAYVFLERADGPVVSVLGSAELEIARAKLEETIARITEREFPVAAPEERDWSLCRGCPALRGLCTGHEPS